LVNPCFETGRHRAAMRWTRTAAPSSTCNDLGIDQSSFCHSKFSSLLVCGVRGRCSRQQSHDDNGDRSLSSPWSFGLIGSPAQRDTHAMEVMISLCRTSYFCTQGIRLATQSRESEIGPVPGELTCPRKVCARGECIAACGLDMK
jgi:hypothetical protein